MKNFRSFKLIVSMLLSVSALTSIGVNAQWRQDNTGWWYTEGDSWKVGWELIDGQWYYFAKDGYMQTGWLKDSDGKWYYLNEDGKMAHDVSIDGYMLGADGARIEYSQKPYQKLEELPQKYSVVDAQKNGDVLQALGYITYNSEKLDKFIENYQNKKANAGDMVRILMFGEDGGPTIRDLIITDKGGIKLKSDSTRDYLSSDEDRIVKEYEIVKVYAADSSYGCKTYYAETSTGEQLFLGNLKTNK